MTLQERLDALGACVASDDVAKLLADAGARGRPKRPYACPIANWLTDAPDCENARVAHGELAADNADGEQIDLCLAEWSKAVGVFVDRFDRGHFSNLEADQR